MNPETMYQKSEKHHTYLRAMQNSMACMVEMMMKLEEQETFAQADADEIENLLFELRYSWTKFKMTPTMIVERKGGNND